MFVSRSTHFSDAPVPDFTAALASDLSTAAYTLSDMAVTASKTGALGDEAHLGLSNAGA